MRQTVTHTATNDIDGASQLKKGSNSLFEDALEANGFLVSELHDNLSVLEGHLQSVMNPIEDDQESSQPSDKPVVSRHTLTVYGNNDGLNAANRRIREILNRLEI